MNLFTLLRFTDYLSYTDSFKPVFYWTKAKERRCILHVKLCKETRNISGCWHV